MYRGFLKNVMLCIILHAHFSTGTHTVSATLITLTL